MTTGRKSFKNDISAAELFIDAANPPEAAPVERQPDPEEPITVPEGWRPPTRRTATPKPEPRSKRLHILLQPSLYETIRANAEWLGVSINEYIHTALEETIRKEGQA